MRKKFYIPAISVIGISMAASLLYFPDARNYLSSVIAVIQDKCQTVQATTFVKSYRLKDKADTFGIVQATDGGYAITGRTINHNEMKGYGMFWIKADKNGNKGWSKLFDNGNSEGRAITQLVDGNYIAAGNVVDFRTDVEQEKLEGQGDNLVVKIDNKGNTAWTRTVSQQSIDEPFKLSPQKDGGFSMSGATGKLVGKPDVADIMHIMFLGNFTANGVTNWLKKIDADERATKSVEQTKDGGYILIGNIKLKDEDGQNVPALVKLKKNGVYEWSTGLEGVPLEFSMVEPDGKGGFTWKAQPSKMHLPFGTFFEAQQTDDGGYIALGEYFSTASLAPEDISKLTQGFLKESSFVAVKVDAQGKFMWARAMNIKKYLEDSVIKKTKDGGYIIMGNNLVGGYGDSVSAERGKLYKEMMDAYYKKYPFGTPETPASKSAMEKIADTIETTEAPFRAGNVVLVKTDTNFNYQWGKIIGGKKDLNGYDIIQTADSGYAIAGTWHTGIKRKILGSWLEYTEAMILKLDANGNLGNNNGLVTDFTDAQTGDVSSYVVANPLNSPELVVQYPMDNVKRAIRVGDKKGVGTTASEVKNYSVTFCNTLGKNGSVGNGGTTFVTKTRSQMKYEATKEIEATSNKGKLIHGELMPVLKDVFMGEVKLWEDFAGGWVAYRFKRLVTRDDIERIMTSIKGLGYNIDTNANGDFTATKIGSTLNFHFKLGDKNAGQLDVTY